MLSSTWEREWHLFTEQRQRLEAQRSELFGGIIHIIVIYSDQLLERLPVLMETVVSSAESSAKISLLDHLVHLLEW